MEASSVGAREADFAAVAEAGGGGTTGRFISTQRAGGHSGLPASGRFFLVFGGNTLAAVLAATGDLDLAIAVGIGLGLVFLVWLFDVGMGLLTRG